MAQSIKSCILIGAGRFGDGNAETDELAGDFFQIAQEYTGHNAKLHYCETLEMNFGVSLPITLDKSASWKATLSGGAGPGIKFWCYASSHCSVEAGQYQPYISPRWKNPEEPKCKRPNCACGTTPPDVACHVPSRNIWVSF